jgi:hypothetical protein
MKGKDEEVEWTRYKDEEEAPRLCPLAVPGPD